MPDDKTCAHCGARTVEYVHNLNAPMVGALVSLYDFAGTGPWPKSKMELTTYQYANLQKLRYWGLIEPDVTEDNRDRRGIWRVSLFGRDFILGRMTCREKVVTYRGRPLRTEGEARKIHEIIRGYDYRAHYSDTALAHGQAVQPNLI